MTFDVSATELMRCKSRQSAQVLVDTDSGSPRCSGGKHVPRRRYIQAECDSRDYLRSVVECRLRDMFELPRFAVGYGSLTETVGSAPSNAIEDLDYHGVVGVVVGVDQIPVPA